MEMVWYNDPDNAIRDIAQTLFRRKRMPSGLSPLSAVRAALAEIGDPVLQAVKRMK
jgi:hypothetical protein